MNMSRLELLKKIRLPLTIGTHLFICIFTYFLAFLLRFDLSIPPHYVMVISRTLPIIVFLKMISFYYFGLFHSSLRYSSVFDLWQVIKANTLAAIIFTFIIVVSFRNIAYPRSIIILEWGFCLGLTGGIRLIARLWRERRTYVSTNTKLRKTLIVGAGEAGILVLKECRTNPLTNYRIVGFIDDAFSKGNLTIQGVPVLGKSPDIHALVDKYQIEEIIIAIPSAKGKDIRNIINYCQIPNIKIKTIPGIHEFISGDLKLDLREIRPDDLLDRKTVSIDKEKIKDYIQDKRILITGAAGTIGSELVRQIIEFFPRQIILVDHNENDLVFLEIEVKEKHPYLSLKSIVGDISDVSLLKSTFSKFKPEIVFHTAAFKHVPIMEFNASAAIQNNVFGSLNLIYAAEHYGVKSFVLISSDKAVNPTSVMGATKRITEMILQAKSKKCRTKFMAVRFGNVLDSKGSVVPLFKKQIEQRAPLTVTHPDVKRYFMSVKEAVSLVLQASSIGTGGEVFTLDMGEQIKIQDLARNLIALSGLKPEIDIPIKYIGLRPGEKLYEETLHDSEKGRTTKYEKIFITQPNDFDPYKLRKQLRKLKECVKLRDDRKIIDLIREIVPSYTYSGRNND